MFLLKKKKQYTLSINEPCHEDWQQMLPATSGRFCLHCQKKVTDFTHLSDREIIRLVKQNPDGLCGRLNSNQLNSPIIEAKEPNTFVRFYRILAGLLLFGGATKGVAQKLTPPKQAITVDKQIQSKEKIKSNAANKNFENIIEGTLLDSITKKPIPDVAIYAININPVDIYTSSDAHGYFKLQIPDSLLKDSIDLMFDGPYQNISEIITVTKKELPIKRDFKLLARKVEFDRESFQHVGSISIDNPPKQNPPDKKK